MGVNPLGLKQHFLHWQWLNRLKCRWGGGGPEEQIMKPAAQFIVQWLCWQKSPVHRHLWSQQNDRRRRLLAWRWRLEQRKPADTSSHHSFPSCNSLFRQDRQESSISLHIRWPSLCARRCRLSPWQRGLSVWQRPFPTWVQGFYRGHTTWNHTSSQCTRPRSHGARTRLTEFPLGHFTHSQARCSSGWTSQIK